MKMILDEKLFNESVYTENGFKDRNDYLNSLADDYGIDIGTVKELASVLGPSEDFDALVTELEDMMYDKFNTSDEDEENLDKQFSLWSYYSPAMTVSFVEDQIDLDWGDEPDVNEWIWDKCSKGFWVKLRDFFNLEDKFYRPVEFNDEDVEDLLVDDAYRKKAAEASMGDYYESLKEGKGSDIPNYKVLTSKSIIDTDWYGDFDDEEEAENARMEVVDEWDDFLKPSGFGGFYDDETVYKLHFFNSPFRDDKVIYGTIYDGVEYLAIKDGVDLVKFDNGNLGFVSSYSGKLDGFEILGKPTEKELHDYDYGDEVSESLKEGATEDADFIVPIVAYTSENLDASDKLDSIKVSLKDLYKKYGRRTVDLWLSNAVRDGDNFIGFSEFEEAIKTIAISKWQKNKNNNSKFNYDDYDFGIGADKVIILNSDLIPTQVKKLSRFLGKKLLSNQNESLNSQDQYDLSSAIYNAVSDVIFNSGKLDIDEKDVKFAFDRFIKKFFLDESFNKNKA